jgi:catechol 2,3-dioxygenase-like lactoylglutathione lyase family enzyme
VLYGPSVLDHISLAVADVATSVAFYEQVFGPAGLRTILQFPGRDGATVAGLGGPDGQPRFWLGPGRTPGTPETHIAFSAPDRAAVDAVHAAAVAAGVEVLHGPREFPEYHPGYYGVFVRDPDGNNVEAVHHGFTDAAKAALA